MTSPLHAPALDQANHALGVEREGSPSLPDPDPEAPLDGHASHAFVLAPGGRWLECSQCGTRDHWAAAASPCRCASARTPHVSRASAIAAIRSDLEAFEWWALEALPEALPTLDEWAANFHEWRIAR